MPTSKHNRPPVKRKSAKPIESVRSKAIRDALYLMLFVLVDKHEAKPEELEIFANELNEYAEHIQTGRITWEDVRKTVQDEYKIYLPW